MSEKNVLAPAGLHTSANGFSAVPDGALVEAHNVQIIQKNVLEPRRGRETLEPSVLADQLIFHDGRVVIHNEEEQTLHLLSSDETTVSDYSQNYGAPAREETGRIRSVTADNRTYFTSGKGVYRLEDVDTEPELSGAPQAGDIFTVESTSETDGFLEIGNTCAYRIVIGKYDAQGNLLLGPPSGRAFAYVLESDSDPRNFTITFPVPEEATTDYFYRIYRSSQVSLGTEPDDELSLVLWKNFVSDDLSAGQVSVVDTTPDELLGDPLYTNPNSGEGFLQANNSPPVSGDIALWSERMWYSNTKQEQSLEIQLLGVGEGEDGATGLRAMDVITVAGQNYQAIYPDDPPSEGQFAISTNSDPALVIEQTARGLVSAINGNNIAVVAYYQSLTDQLPGKILLKAKEKGTSPFAVTLNAGAHGVTNLFRESGTVVVTFDLVGTTHEFKVGDTFTLACSSAPSGNFPVGIKTVASVVDADQITYVEAGSDASEAVANYTATRLTPEPSFAWNPELPTSGTSVSSDADEVPHRLYYSKFQQLEAVPAINFLDIGVKEKPIYRIHPLGRSLIVFKEDGIYSVSGSTVPFSVSCIDQTVQLLAPDTVQMVKSKLYAFTNQGVVSVDINGVDIVSKPIENVFVRLTKEFKTDPVKRVNILRNSFAISRETDRLYILYPITGNEGTTAYVFNTMFGTWTTWDGAHVIGGVSPTTDSLYFGSLTGSKLYKERRDLLETDYYDSESLKNVDDFGTYTGSEHWVAVPSASGVSVGDAIGYAGEYGLVVGIDGATIRYRASAQLPFVADTNLTVYHAFETRIKFNTILGGSPNSSKQFREMKLHFKAKFNYAVDFITSTDLDPVTRTQSYEDERFDISDSLEWGSWEEPIQIRVGVPQQHQYATYFHVKLRIKEAQSYWQLNGLSLTFEPISSSTMM